MTLTLSPIVAALLAAHNAHEADAFIDCFTADATLRDEGRAYHGLPAIRAWFDDVCRRYQPAMDVSAIAEIDGEIVLSGTVSGSFEGSPVGLRFIVATEDEKIVALRIVP